MTTAECPECGHDVDIEYELNEAYDDGHADGYKETAEDWADRLERLGRYVQILDRREVVAILGEGLARDLERGAAARQALEVTAEPRTWVFAPYHACVLCEAGRCPACDGECKVPAMCDECAR